MRLFEFWQRWLLTVGCLLVVFGALLAFLNQTWIFNAILHPIDVIFWPDGDKPSTIIPFQAWIYGVLGMTVAGWGVFVIFLAQYPFKQRERWVWNCLFVGITLWFVADSAISAYFGVFFNVVFNAVLAGLMYLPLLATWTPFGSGGRGALE